MKTKIYGRTVLQPKHSPRTLRLTKRVTFSAMHELRSPALTEPQNRAIFGKCYNLHGHDYRLEVTVEGQLDEKTGLICDRDFFDAKLDKYVVKKYNGKNLNDFFSNTTGEILVSEFLCILEKLLKPLNVVGIKLEETPKNTFSAGTTAYLLGVF